MCFFQRLKPHPVFPSPLRVSGVNPEVVTFPAENYDLIRLIRHDVTSVGSNYIQHVTVNGQTESECHRSTDDPEAVSPPFLHEEGFLGQIVILYCSGGCVIMTSWKKVRKVNFVATWLGSKYGRQFADDSFKHIFVNENFCISTWISLRFVPKGPIYNWSAWVQVMAWRWTADKPLPKPMLTQFTDAYMRH